MEKIKIFVSFFSEDNDKKKILQDLIEKYENFTAVVVTRQQQPMIALTEKVKKGILSSKYFIPILTERSIITQWINQEIGFAVASNKIIRPVVEKIIIDRLKGFIHREVDLSFNYGSNNKKGIENRNFSQEVKKLLEQLHELETPTSINSTVTVKPQKAPEEEIIERKRYVLERNNYINSVQGQEDVRNEVIKIIDYFKKYNDTSRVTNTFSSDVSSLVFYIAEDNFMLYSELDFRDYEPQNWNLLFELRQKAPGINYPQAIADYPNVITSQRYYFTMNEGKEVGWSSYKERGTNSFQTSESLASQWKNIFVSRLKDHVQNL